MHDLNINLDTAVAVLTVAMPFLVAAAQLAYKAVLAKLPAQKRAAVAAEVALIVSAVEQLYKAVPRSGAYKKAEVIRLAKSLGLNVSPARLDLLIESAVAALPPTKPSGTAS